ncbi:MAG: hypothetical protein IJH91_05585 [Mogibacterium sp.]|nr:hypothetical protein [Mogibacterium sp.]
MAEEKKKRSNILTDVIYLAITGAFAWVCYILFCKMIENPDKRFNSDLPYYVKRGLMAEDQSIFRMPFVVFRFICNHFDPVKGTAAFLAILIALIIFANYFYLKHWGGIDTKARGFRILTQLMSIGALFAGPIYVKGIHEHFYKNTYASFAWHSPTQQMMTFFTVLALICFFKMVENYEEHISPLCWIGSMLFFLLSAYAKPSFILIFGPAVILVFLGLLIKGSEISMGKRFRRLILMGLTLVPSGVYILIINFLVYESENKGSNNNVVIDTSNMMGMRATLIAMACSMAFAGLVFLFNIKDIFWRKNCLILLCAIFGYLELFFLSESGSRASHGNFGWGQIIGCYVLMLTAMAILLENMKDKQFLKGIKPLRFIYFVLALGVLVLHVASNVFYFYLIFTGHGYWR